MQSGSKTHLLLKVLATVIFGAILFYGGFIVLIIMAMSAAHDVYFAVAFVFFIEILVLGMLFLWTRPLLKKLRKAFIAVSLLTVIVWGGFYAYGEYDESIPVLRDRGINLGEYEPFHTKSKLARLEHPASLQIASELPKIDSATALYPVVAAFVEAVYPKGNYTYGKQEILTQTTTRKAFDRLADGEVDMIFAAAPSAEQIKKAAEKGVEFKLIPIGKEGFVFFVNAQNPVDSLSIDQIQSIYSGNINNWQQVGGQNQSIKAFQREKDSGSQTRLEQLMAGHALQAAPQSETTGGMGGIIRRTADYKNYNNALGFSFRYYATEMVKNNQIKLLRINGIEAGKETIRSGKYPLTGELYAITAKSQNPNLEKFIDWILSEEGQQLVEESGYVGIK